MSRDPSYAIVDIETTGNYTNRSKITEIAILVFDGTRIVDSFHSLINPESSIPPYIVSLTGITNKMVENAPRFYEVAKEIFTLLEGKIFVAHNVNFDYNFVRQEFKSLGGDFQARKLCTVRLARKILPGLSSYGLGNLARHLDIFINGRHRAHGDAEATVKIFAHLLAHDKEDHIGKALKRNSPEGSLPPNLPKSQFLRLPEKTGVYYFFDQKGKVIYVGKAKNIKNRVKGHFSTGSDTSQKQNLFRNIHGIDYEVCGNELIALLFETYEIQRLWPAFNRAHKRLSWNYGVYQYEDRNGYKRLSVSKINRHGDPLIVFRSLMDARNFVKRKVDEYELCQKLCGLQKSPHSCFDYQIKQCNGACIGKEKPGVYNKRMNRALQSLMKSDQTVAIIGEGRELEESSVVWIENGRYQGFGYFETSTEIIHPGQLKEYIKSYPDNQDIQGIIQLYMHKNKDYRVVPVV